MFQASIIRLTKWFKINNFKTLNKILNKVIFKFKFIIIYIYINMIFSQKNNAFLTRNRKGRIEYFSINLWKFYTRDQIICCIIKENSRNDEWVLTNSFQFWFDPTFCTNWWKSSAKQ